MNKLTISQAIIDDQINWKISIFRENTSLDEALCYSQRIVDRIECVENISSCASDISYNNCIILFEKRCKYADLKIMLEVLICLIESPFELMCCAKEKTKEQIVGVSSPNQIWGITIFRDGFTADILNDLSAQFKEIVLVHEDERYLNYTFKSSYFEFLDINPFEGFLIIPYPNYDECFPWKDNGIRYKIKYIPNKILWDTSGDDLSILPEMW